jgi:hypothetical protein
MSTPKDDLEATRIIVDALSGLKPNEQQRAFRWAAEKLNLSQPPNLVQPGNLPSSAQTPPHSQTPATTPTTVSTPTASANIKTFVHEKKPRNDVQYAAAVAYYHRFEAPQAERKEEINQDDLQEATRKTGRERFKYPYQTLSNAHKLGLLDRGSEKGMFTINTVGENLVAMTLPDGTSTAKPPRKRPNRAAGKRPAKKSAKVR